MRLRSKTALITGAARGIGLALARAYARARARLGEDFDSVEDTLAAVETLLRTLLEL